MRRIVERRIVVDVPAAAAWERLSRVEEWPRWAPHISSVTLDPTGPLAARSNGSFRFRGGLRSRFQVTEFEPSVRWKWQGRAIGLVIDYDHLFEPLDDRRTTLTWTVDAEGPRFAERLFARAYTRKLDRAIPRLIAFMTQTFPSEL